MGHTEFPRNLALGAIALSAFVACATPVERAPARAEPDRAPYRGSVTTRAVVRTAGSDRDVDLTAYVEADLGDTGDGPGPTGAEARWSARFAGRLHADLDGDRGDAFDGLDDSHDSRVVARVYDAWAAWAPESDTVRRVRFGRQSDADTPVFVVYDGVRVESAPLGEADLSFGAYGGASTHQYESSNDGDRLFGLWAAGTPWHNARARADWLHAEDERTIGAQEDDLFGLSLRQRLSREWRASAAWTALGSEGRDLDLDATWNSVDGRRLVRATYYELFETQRANPLEFDTFSDTLFDWFPFRRGTLLGSTRIDDDWRIEGGYDVREVHDEADEGRFNRDVRRAHLTAAWEGALGAGTTLSLTGEQWRSDARDVETYGVTLAKKLAAGSDVSIGTYYAAYEFDELLLLEREDVRTWFTSYGRKLDDALDLDASYSFQDTEFEEFHTLRMTLRWHF